MLRKLNDWDFHCRLRFQLLPQLIKVEHENVANLLADEKERNELADSSNGDLICQSAAAVQKPIR